MLERYKKAKEEELNLGLDLQGGMNVTLEVEMSGLLRSLANNSTDPSFLNAIQNADLRKANSDADFITLFIQEYRKLEANRPLATLFSGASSNVINIKSTDQEVEKYIRDQARAAGKIVEQFEILKGEKLVKLTNINEFFNDAYKLMKKEKILEIKSSSIFPVFSLQ